MAVSRKTNDTPVGVNLDRLAKLAERWDARKSKADDARSDLGTLAKEVEDLGFNRAAFKLTMRLRNMEAAKRADFLSSLNAYCDKLGVFAQADLFGDTTSNVGPAEGDKSAREIGFADGREGVRDHADRYPQGEPGHGDYELGWNDGQAAKVHAEIKPTAAADDDAFPGTRAARRQKNGAETHASA